MSRWNALQRNVRRTTHPKRWEDERVHANRSFTGLFGTGPKQMGRTHPPDSGYETLYHFVRTAINSLQFNEIKNYLGSPIKSVWRVSYRPISHVLAGVWIRELGGRRCQPAGRVIARLHVLAKVNADITEGGGTPG